MPIKITDDPEVHVTADELARFKADYETRDQRQSRVAKWCADAFGQEQTTSVEQRGLRLAEETIEAAQAAECNPATLHKLVDYVYARPVGELRQELGGVGLCLLAMANAASLSADDIECAEIARVFSKPLSVFSERNKQKNDAGFTSSPAPEKPKAEYAGLMKELLRAADDRCGLDCCYGTTMKEAHDAIETLLARVAELEGDKAQLREIVMIEAADIARKATLKWGDPIGTEYQQGVQDHGNRIVRMLDLASNGKAEGGREETLFGAIAHGDEKHRAWLKQAIQDHFAGRSVQRPDAVREPVAAPAPQPVRSFESTFSATTVLEEMFPIPASKAEGVSEEIRLQHFEAYSLASRSRTSHADSLSIALNAVVPLIRAPLEKKFKAHTDAVTDFLNNLAEWHGVNTDWEGASTVEAKCADILTAAEENWKGYESVQAELSALRAQPKPPS